MSRQGRRLVVRATSLALFLGGVPAWAVPPALCDSLDDIPVHYQVSYQAGIQGIFSSHCTQCHEGDAPPANLNLSNVDNNSWVQLVNHASSQDASLTRVVPNHPEQSLLFHKVNCDTPGVGHRMPLFDTELSGEEQALLYDWIAGGAPATSLDVLFRGEFELRN